MFIYCCQACIILSLGHKPLQIHAYSSGKWGTHCKIHQLPLLTVWRPGWRALPLASQSLSCSIQCTLNQKIIVLLNEFHCFKQFCRTSLCTASHQLSFFYMSFCQFYCFVHFRPAVCLPRWLDEVSNDFVDWSLLIVLPVFFPSGLKAVIVEPCCLSFTVLMCRCKCGAGFHYDILAGSGWITLL